MLRKSSCLYFWWTTHTGVHPHLEDSGRIHPRSGANRASTDRVWAYLLPVQLDACLMISNLILILHLLIAAWKGTVTHAYWFCQEKLLCKDSECFSCHRKTNRLYTKLRCLPYPQTSITVLLLWFLEVISSFSSSKLRQPLSKLLSLTQTIQTTQNTFASRANFLAKHTQHSFFVFI